MTWLTQTAQTQGLKIGKTQMGRTGYSVGFNMLGQFVYNNEEKLKQLQMQPNIDKMENMLGKENYDRLSRAAEDCVMTCVRNGREVRSEISKVANWDTSSRIELSQMDVKWSPATTRYLEAHVEAKAVFDSLKHNQHFVV